MRVARTLVTPEFMRQALNLPCTTTIVGVCMATEGGVGVVMPHDLIELTVSDSALRDVELEDGELPPFVEPTFQRREPIEFLGWNQT